MTCNAVLDEDAETTSFCLHDKENFYISNCTVKIKKSLDTKNFCNYPKIWPVCCYHLVLHPKGVHRIAGSVDLDQIAPSVWSESTLRRPAQIFRIIV